METTRVSNRLRAKRFKAGNATAEDKAYMEKKYNGLCDMNGYVSPFPPGEDPYVKEWTYTPLPSNYVEKKAQKKPKRTLSDDSILLRAALIKSKQKKAQAKFEEDMSKIVLERERCESLMKESLEVKKPTLIIEEDDEVVEETFTQNDAIYLNSLIGDRTNKMRNLMSLDEEIERLEKKRANYVSEKCVEMTPERFRNILSDLGYIKK
jgi:hypothetical protein